MLCCPVCTIQYLNFGRVPDTREHELQAYENSFHFFIGENEPSS